ncbi:MAG: exosortase/archaeosortase family protein, partial [Planctomycetota bacterium]
QYFAHCWLVPLVGAVVVFRQRGRWRQAARTPDPRGWWLLAPGLLLHLVGALLMIDSWSAASLWLVVPGAAWLALGLQRLRGLWPVLGLSLFVVPAPIYVEDRAAFELKELAVGGGVALANALGAGVVQHGAHLLPSGLPGSLWVADECGGLRSLLAMLTLAYCLAFFTGPPSVIRRSVLLVAAPVFALLANVLRIALLCLFARWWGVPFAEGAGHDVANVAEWVVLVAALLLVDRTIPWREAPPRGVLPPSPPPATASAGLAGPAVALWLLAGPLLGLSLYRPQGPDTRRAEALPVAFAGWTAVPRTAAEQAAFQANLPRWCELLGTGDFVWRRYRDASGAAINLVALFHDTNWKSVHPPRICIEGSGMAIEIDDEVVVPALGDGLRASRIVATSRKDGWRYVTLSLFGTVDWAAGDYAAFTWHHLARAVVRANMSGFLLRVESPVRAGEAVAAAEARCGGFLEALLPLARERLR